MKNKKNGSNVWVWIMIYLFLGIFTFAGMALSVVFVFSGGIEKLGYNPNATAAISDTMQPDNSSANTNVVTSKRNTNVQIAPTNTVDEVVSNNANDLSEVVEKAMPSIVSINTVSTKTYNNFFGSYSEDVEGCGSGIIFEINDECIYIVTNNHVVSGSKQLQIRFVDDTLVEGSVKGKDSVADIAVVTVKVADISKETLAEIKAAALGTTEDVKVGHMVLAIGNALGYGQSVTVGYISAKGREVTIDNNAMKLIQTDAAINPGNSGGALISLSGEVIGINSVKYSDESVEGMGYAIPIETVKPIIENIKNKVEISEEERGYLGIYYREVTDELHSMYNIPYGLYVSELVEGGAAQQGGVFAGDVIIAVNGTEVTDSETLQEILAEYRYGEKVVLTICRYNRGRYDEGEVEVTLMKKSWE